MLDFLDFGFLDALDIVLVAILLYYVYKLVRGTVAINIFLGIAIIFLIWKLTAVLEMEMLSEILGKFLGGGVLLLLIVFQQEIRKFLLMLGSTNFASKRGFLKQMSFLKSDVQVKTNVDAIVDACKAMSKTKTGALIVIAKNNSLENFKITGDDMHIEVNEPILKSIFFKNSTLHDGAIIIEDNIITATRVILPVDRTSKLPTRFGLRHRAAVGISLQVDALVLIVSEETGKIAYIKNGEFVLFNDTDKLVELIKEDLE
jgi:uncharacterized protein (TIGR00159 family)